MYSSKYKIGQEVILNSPFEVGTKGIIDGIRFERGTIRYDVCVNNEYNIERIFPDIIRASNSEDNTQVYPDTQVYTDALPINDDEYYLIINKVVMKNCRILGLNIFENSGLTTYRYKVGIFDTLDVISDVNQKLIFKKEEAISYIRDMKIDDIVGKLTLNINTNNELLDTDDELHTS